MSKIDLDYKEISLNDLSDDEEDILEDIVTINLDSISIDINFYSLCKYSQLIREKYLISDVNNRLPQDLKAFIQENNIIPESVTIFLMSIKEEKLIMTSDNFLELSKLSEFFQVKRFIKKLKKFAQLHINDLDFIIQKIIDEINSPNLNKRNQFQITIEMQNYLSQKISECLQNDKFTKLPISVIYNIIEKSDRKQLSSDLLFNFIKKSFENFHVLFIFLDLQNLSDENFQELYQMYTDGSNDSIERYFEFLPCNLTYIKTLKESMNDIRARMNELEADKNELKMQMIEAKKNKDILLQKVIDLENNKIKINLINLHIKICKATNILKRNDDYKADSYVTVQLKSLDKNEKQKTQVRHNSRKPVWNHEFDLMTTDPNDTLIINMFDKEIIKNDRKIMDELQFPIILFPIGSPNEIIKEKITMKSQNAGKLYFEVQSVEGDPVKYIQYLQKQVKYFRKKQKDSSSDTTSDEDYAYSSDDSS